MPVENLERFVFTQLVVHAVANAEDDEAIEVVQPLVNGVKVVKLVRANATEQTVRADNAIGEYFLTVCERHFYARVVVVFPVF